MAPRGSADESDASKACRELDRLRKLIEDAVPSLMRSFEKIAELTAAQSGLLEESLGAVAAETHAEQRSSDGSDEVRTARLRLARTYDAHIQHQMHTAVTCLQFEDMALQLISHLRERVERMENDGWRAGKNNDDWKHRTFGPITAEGLNPGSVDLF